MSKKLGFALGGGGSRGVAHVGFLKAMEENGIIPDFISGTSMGAIVGACYAKGMSATEIMDEVKKLKVSHVFDLSLNPIGNGALLRSKKLRKKLQEYLGDITYDRLNIPFCAVSTDLVSGEPVVHKGEELVLDGVVASSSVPGVFKPVTMGDRTLIDDAKPRMYALLDFFGKYENSDGLLEKLGQGLVFPDLLQGGDQRSKFLQPGCHAEQRRVFGGILADRQHGNMLHRRNIADGVQRHAADLTLGLVDDPLQTKIVGRVVDEAEIGKNILDLFSFVESGAAQHTVGNAALGKNLFYGIGLGIGAVQHRKIAVFSLLAAYHLGDLFGDIV